MPYVKVDGVWANRPSTVGTSPPVVSVRSVPTLAAAAATASSQSPEKRESFGGHMAYAKVDGKWQTRKSSGAADGATALESEQSPPESPLAKAGGDSEKCASSPMLQEPSSAPELPTTEVGYPAAAQSDLTLPVAPGPPVQSRRYAAAESSPEDLPVQTRRSANWGPIEISPEQLLEEMSSDDEDEGEISPELNDMMQEFPAFARQTCGVAKRKVVTEHASDDFVNSHYLVKKELGQGAHGKVKLVVDRKTRQERVCKFVSTKKMSAEMIETMRKEVSLLCRLDHPGVVKIFEHAFEEESGELVIVLELLRGGDGIDLLEKADGNPLSEKLLGRLVFQALTALCYCHSQGVVHRDLKPENLMFLESVDLDAHAADCKLVDFGIAEAPLRGLFGTAEYMAPEVAALHGNRTAGEAKDCTAKADVWSLGVTVFELLMDIKPFDGRDSQASFFLLKQFSDYKSLEKKFAQKEIWGQLSAEAHNFLETLLVADPEKRPSALEALKHPWIEMHRGARTHLGPEMVQSLAAYPSAPCWVRCCLFAIATRSGVDDPQHFSEVFLGLDKDVDGIIVREEFAEALQILEGGDAIDVEAILDAADLDHNGGIDFTEFLAVCSFSRYYSEPSLDSLMKKSFHALDDDRDDLLRVEEVRSVFRERDAVLFESLPQDAPFGIDEWCSCLRGTL